MHEFPCFYGNDAHAPTVVPRPFFLAPAKTAWERGYHLPTFLETPLGSLRATHATNRTLIVSPTHPPSPGALMGRYVNPFLPHRSGNVGYLPKLLYRYNRGQTSVYYGRSKAVLQYGCTKKLSLNKIGRGKVIRRSPPRVGVPIGYVQSPPIAPPGPRWGEWGLLLIGAQE